MSVTAAINRVNNLRKMREALRRGQPRKIDPPDIAKHWTPQEGPQAAFFRSDVFEVLYGGQAGGGKSSVLVATAARWVDVRDYNALILRRETTQLNKLLKEAQKLYPKLDDSADINQQTHTWKFCTGAQVRFNHCQHEKDATDYQGDEFQYIGFDELTHFTRTQYLEIVSRLRGTNPKLPRFIRSTTNPGGTGHEWVFERWGPWLNPEYVFPGRAPRFSPDGRKLPPAEPCEVLWFLPPEHEGELERIVPEGTPEALSRTFIPARLEDNKILLQNDPTYRSTLSLLDPVRRKQLLEGDWLAKPAKGLYFKKIWFKFEDASPTKAKRVRYWDLAAGGDWAVGVKLARDEDGVFWVEHVERIKGTPGEVRGTVKATAEIDGKNVPVRIEQDPGQAGKDQIHSYVTEVLVGWDVKGRPKRADKVIAAGPASSQAEAKNIRIVRAAWNGPFLAVLEEFPDGKHDDDVDALSGALAVLLDEPTPADWDPLFGDSRWN
jgi:predicted phage terminase large subunit-like protein